MIVVLCFIADFKGQFHTLVPNTLLKYLHEVAVETHVIKRVLFVKN